MLDDTRLWGAQDRRRIAMGQAHEVWYWTERLGVSREELERAVEAVGNSVSAIEAFLKRR